MRPSVSMRPAMPGWATAGTTRRRGSAKRIGQTSPVAGSRSDKQGLCQVGRRGEEARSWASDAKAEPERGDTPSKNFPPGAPCGQISCSGSSRWMPCAARAAADACACLQRSREADVARRILACLHLPTRAPPLAMDRPGARTECMAGRSPKPRAPPGATPSGRRSSSIRAPQPSGTSTPDDVRTTAPHPDPVVRPCARRSVSRQTTSRAGPSRQPTARRGA